MELSSSSLIVSSSSGPFIFGYGSLMSLSSIQSTMPSATHFQSAILFHYRRIFNLVSISGIRNHLVNMETNECAALSIIPDSCDDVMNPHYVCGCVFQLQRHEEFALYLEREHRYKCVEVEVVLSSSLQPNHHHDQHRNVPQISESLVGNHPKTLKCWTVITQSDEEYRLSMPGGEEEWNTRIHQYYNGQLWGRTDILPMRKYLMNVLLATWQHCSVDWILNLLNDTLIADGHTSLRSYLLQNSQFTANTSSRIFDVAEYLPIDLLQVIVNFSPELLITRAMLLSRANELDHVGNNALHLAAFHGRLNDVKSLIVIGVDFNARSSTLETPLTLACAAEHVEVVRTLLQAGADPNIPCERGWSPIHIVCENSSDHCMELIELLVSFNADPLASTHDGEKAIQLTQNESIKLFLFRSSSGDRKRRRVSDEVPGPINEMMSGRSILHNAVLSGDATKVHQCLLESIDQEKLLVVPDAQGNTPFHYACYHNYLDVLQVILTQCDLAIVMSALKARNVNGESPLDFGCLNGHFDVITKLVPKYVPDVNDCDAAGWTALHCACCKPRPLSAEIVRRLLMYGADKNRRTEDGCFPSDLTTDTAILELLTS